MSDKQNDNAFHCDRLDAFLLQCRVNPSPTAYPKAWAECQSQTKSGSCPFNRRCGIKTKDCDTKGYDGTDYAKLQRSKSDAKETRYGGMREYSINSYESVSTD